jgi:hypothetical protein
MSRLQIATLAGVLLLAAGVGLAWGLRSLPPGETAIIEAAAARYVTETGGAPTDCAARPAPLEGVRLIVSCGPADGAPWVEALDTWGNPVEIDPSDEGPST